MSCLTLQELLAAQFVTPISGGAVEVAVEYYPQVLTGYDTATQVRDPSEETAVAVSGLWYDEGETITEGALVRSAKFSFLAATTLEFEPHALDGLIYNGRKYRVRSWLMDGLNYVQTLESEGIV